MENNQGGRTARSRKPRSVNYDNLSAEWDGDVQHPQHESDQEVYSRSQKANEERYNSDDEHVVTDGSAYEPAVQNVSPSGSTRRNRVRPPRKSDVESQNAQIEPENTDSDKQGRRVKRRVGHKNEVGGYSYSEAGQSWTGQGNTGREGYTSFTPGSKEEKSVGKVILKIMLWVIGVLLGLFILLIIIGIMSEDETESTPLNDTTLVTDEAKDEESGTVKGEDLTISAEPAAKPEAEAKSSEAETGSPKVESPASPKEPKTEKDSNADLLTDALLKDDYTVVQKLANQGYAPAYLPLSKFYLRNNEYNDAEKYAKKAQAAGQKGADEVLTTLRNLGFYD